MLLLGPELTRCLYSEGVAGQSGSFYEDQCPIKQEMSSHRARRSAKQQLDRSGTRERMVEWRGSRGPVHKEVLVLVFSSIRTQQVLDRSRDLDGRNSKGRDAS
jgi:hypothetical protein